LHARLTDVVNGIGEVMVRMVVSNDVDRRVQPWSVETKGYKIDICCFATKH